MKRKRFLAILGCVLSLVMLAGIAIPFASAADYEITFLNPLGEVEPMVNQPLAERIDDLEGKKILPLYDQGNGGLQAVNAIIELLAAEYKTVSAAAVGLGATNALSTFGPKTDGVYDAWAASADAAIIGVVNENIAAWWIPYHAKQLEARGMPVVVVVNEQFAPALISGAQDNGIAALRTVVIETAVYAKAFVQGTNTNTVQNYMRDNVFAADFVSQIAASLTSPVTASEMSIDPLDATVFGYIEGDVFTVSGPTYDRAVENFYALSSTMNFGDGLPLVIPTQQLVDDMLAATDRGGDEILGKIKLRGGIVTVEKVAINAVMAGARPEHFNAILAAMEAYVSAWEDNKMWYHALTTSDNFTVVFMLSGPIVNELNASHGRSFGHSGNEPLAVIGKSIKLCIRNIGHSTNANASARHDRVNDHTLYSFGEHYDETRTIGWATHSENIGFGYDSNSITLVAAAFSQAFATVGGERTYSVISNIRLGSANRAALVTITPEAARALAADTDEIIINNVTGSGYKTKDALQLAMSGATPNANVAKTAWPVIAGKNPTNGRAFYNAMYGVSAFQTQLISKSIVVPSAPQNLEVIINNDGTAATLSWAEPSRTGNLVKYQVSKDDGASWVDIDAEATTYTFGNLTPGTQYFFAVRAVNDIFNAAEVGGSGTADDPNTVSSRASGRGAWAYSGSVFTTASIEDNA